VENSAELQATAYSSLTGKSRDTAAESLSVTNISQGIMHHPAVSGRFLGTVQLIDFDVVCF